VTGPQQSCPGLELILGVRFRQVAFKGSLRYLWDWYSWGGDSNINNDKVIQLDPCKLLGLSQVARVSDNAADSEVLGRVLSKIGENGSTPIENSSPTAKLLSKIGEGA